VIINLQATGSYVALSEIEIYVREDPTATTQTPYSNENGTGYILPEGADTNFEFDKVTYISIYYFISSQVILDIEVMPLN
jgi:hypothetical protein